MRSNNTSRTTLDQMISGYRLNKIIKTKHFWKKQKYNFRMNEEKIVFEKKRKVRWWSHIFYVTYKF